MRTLNASVIKDFKKFYKIKRQGFNNPPKKVGTQVKEGNF